MSGKDKPVHSPISSEEAESLSRGKITISDEVVAAIAAQGARKIKGVVVTGSSFRLSEILGGKEGSYKGVSVKTDEMNGHVKIDLDVNVFYGVNIYETMEKLQRQIANDVEAMTGSMIVDEVNIRVKTLTIPDETPSHEGLTPDKALAEGLMNESKKSD